MKNILVLSDLHYDTKNLAKIMSKFADADYIVFCGDGKKSFLQQASKYADKIIAVSGNCDTAFGSEEVFFEVEGLKILVTHGHRFGVKSGLYGLAEFCQQNGAQVAFFGHTHFACDVKECGVRMINAGAISDLFDASYYFCSVFGEKLVGKHVGV